MPARRTVAPAVEPITLAEAKAHLRLRTNDQDARVEAAIRAARDAVERAIERPLITQTWELRVAANDEHGRAIVLPWASPLVELIDVVIDRVGSAPVTVADTQYGVDTTDDPASLVWAGVTTLGDLTGYSAPRPFVVVRYVVGYGDAPEDVPPALIQLVYWYTAQYFLNRAPSEVLPVSQRLSEAEIVNPQEIIDRFRVVSA